MHANVSIYQLYSVKQQHYKIAVHGYECCIQCKDIWKYYNMRNMCVCFDKVEFLLSVHFCSDLNKNWNLFQRKAQSNEQKPQEAVQNRQDLKKPGYKAPRNKGSGAGTLSQIFQMSYITTMKIIPACECVSNGPWRFNHSVNGAGRFNHEGFLPFIRKENVETDMN